MRDSRAAFSKKSRIRFVNAKNLHRKSGGAKPRDLQFSFPSWMGRAPAWWPGQTHGTRNRPGCAHRSRLTRFKNITVAVVVRYPPTII